MFDWDGTLMDSTGRIVSAMQQTARNLALAIPSEDAVKGIIGLGLTECFNILFPDLKEHAAITEEYRYQYVEGDKTPSPLFDGVEQVLLELKAKGYQLAVATGKAREGLDRVLKVTGLKEFFTHTIGANEVENGKPSPDMLNILMNKSNVSAKQLVMIGDTGFDLQMAQNVGAYSIGVSFGAQSKQQLKLYQPVAIIDQFRQLKAFFNPSWRLKLPFIKLWSILPIWISNITVN
ncbi:HAD family hydrolase [Kangiella sp. TOML190]|uniref:HAD family hydrolase n=1 Tax=Kangiella sp. TOML190 TaxID=2931351 RepID=UPI00255A232F|nr:HAD-IA family hydrolase [Kangiella sp. TOML190]